MQFRQVLLDFGLLFSDNNGSDSLKTNWPLIRKKPFEAYNIELENKRIYHKDDSRHDFLTYLKLFSTQRINFEKLVNSIFIFTDVSKLIFFAFYIYSRFNNYIFH